MNSGVVDKQLHSFSWNHHRQTFFNTVFNLKKQEIFCDVTLACDGMLFPVHRLVLAMCSEFFNEILTKVPCQQPMIVLVPTVGAADLEALLTYIYKGEIQISQANLPSLMKAAQTLKIKGLCNTNNAKSWEQYVRHKQHGETSGENPITDNAGSEGSDSCDDIIFVPPSYSPEETAQEDPFLPESEDNVPAYPKVEVFINSEETYNNIHDGEIKEEKELGSEEEEEAMKDVWMEAEEEEEHDPLSVPLTFSTNSHHPITGHEYTALPLEMTFTEDSDQDKSFPTTTTPPTTGAVSNFRYTQAQRLQIVKYHHTFGPTRAARLMSARLGRKVNESSVRSIVRSWEKTQKLLQKDHELQQT